MNNNLTVNDYLDNLEVDKNKLINSISLINNAVESTDTFTQAIPKINNIENSLTNECFVKNKAQLDELTSAPDIKLGFLKLIKELPDTIALPFQVKTRNGGALSYYSGSKIPVISNADECTNASYFFSYCKGIKEITNFSLLNAETAGSMFYNSGIEKVKNLNLPKTKAVTGLFESCRRLQEVSALTFPLATDFGGFCSGDSALVTVGRLTSNQPIYNMRYAFDYCNKLQSLDLGGLIIDENTDITGMLEYVPTSCQITVRDQKVYDTISAIYPNHTYTIKDLEAISLSAFTNRINKRVHNTLQLELAYNGGPTAQQGVTYSITGNATVSDTGLVTLTGVAQAGDIITVTATSTYNPELTATYTITVYDVELSLNVNLNNGQFVETEELINGNKVYQSDAGSYHTNNGKSIASMEIIGYTKFVVYIKSDAESSYDYTEIFDLDTAPVRDKGVLSTKGKQGQWLRKEFNISSPSTHTISVMYSKDSSGNNGTDRGYFYISESECE